MRKHLAFGAGVNLLLLVLFGLVAAGTGNGVMGTPSLSLAIVQSPIFIFYLVAIGGTALWISSLRALATSRLLHIQNRGALVMHALASGLQLAGLAAWIQWVLTRNGGVQPSFVMITITMAILTSIVAWALDLLDQRANDNETGVDPAQAGSIRDYLMLTKPIVLALLLVTTLAAMIVAGGGMPAAGVLVWTMLGGAFSAGGASALNQYIDRFRDSKMSRTKLRPLPQGRLHSNQVILFGILLCVGGFFTLSIFVNLLSAVMALAGIVYYVVFYSLILKPTTPQNIVIGGGAGAIPPLVGWAAVSGQLSMPAFFLFALVFFWTPPHFWALALLKSRDYARAGVPMLPVVHGPTETRWQIMLYTLQVVALTLLLPLAKLGGWIYFLSALLLGAGLVFYAWRLWRQGGNQPAYKMYRYSSTYLALIFAALVVDTLI